MKEMAAPRSCHILAGVLAYLALHASVSAQVVTLKSEMSTGLVAPHFGSPASAVVEAAVDLSNNSIDIEGIYSGLSGSPVSASLHIAPQGTFGPAILALQTSFSPAGQLTGEGALTMNDVESIMLGDAYLLIRTASYPEGELFGLILLNASSATFNGLELNPPDSLVVLSGSPRIGSTTIVGIDNYLGTQAAPAFVHLGFAFAVTSIVSPGFGMSAPGTLGEALVYPIKCFPPIKAWNGPGDPTSFNLSIPMDSSLVGATVYFQAFIYEPVADHLGFTNGLKLLIGNV